MLQTPSSYLSRLLAKQNVQGFENGPPTCGVLWPEKCMDELQYCSFLFHNSFIPIVRKECSSLGLEQKAVLVLDNCPAHPNEEDFISDDGNISALFLPPNVTSLIQPMNQGVLVALKHRNEKKLLRRLLIDQNEGQEDGDEDEREFIHEIQELGYSMDENEISTWLNSDSNNPGFQLMTDDKICDHVFQSKCLTRKMSLNQRKENLMCVPSPTPWQLICLRSVSHGLNTSLK